MQLLKVVLQEELLQNSIFRAGLKVQMSPTWTWFAQSNLGDENLGSRVVVALHSLKCVVIDYKFIY